MGHLGHLKSEYRQLVRRLGAAPVALPEPRDPRAWEGWKEILEILYTPEEAALAARMPVAPTSLESLARRLRVDVDSLRPRLESMCDRGVVVDLVSPRTRRVTYMLAPPVVGFFEFSMMRARDGIPKKRMAQALEAYVHGDDTFARELFGGETVVGRTLAHEAALGDDVPDVLDWERATAVVGEARLHAVSLCYCRHKAEHLGQRCDAPMDVCLSLNGGAEFVVRRGFGRAVPRAEALDILSRSRDAGLVQIADNVLERPTYVCNCCGCCCGQLQGINEHRLPAVRPSGFLARSDRERCSGCSRCARACPVRAITMEPRRRGATRKNELQPRVDEGLCLGCGVCAGACRRHAMGMARRASRPYVPRTAVERSLRMAMERGHLAQLLLDGAGRGSRFLGAVLRVLGSMPVAERVLASEQVRSRFLRAALGRMRDPTA